MTSGGARPARDLINVPFLAILDGKPHMTLSEGFFPAGPKPTVELITRDGYRANIGADQVVRTATSWLTAQKLRAGDKVVLSDHDDVAPWNGEGSEANGYLIGHLVGDGTFGPGGRAYCAIWDNDGDQPVSEYIERAIRDLGVGPTFKGWFSTSNQRRIGTKGLAALARDFGIVRGNKTVTSHVERSSSDFYRGFLRALFDTDGHIEGQSTGSGVSIRLTWIDLDGLRAVQRMLARLGVRSVIRDCHPAGRESFHGYASQASYRLIITGANAARFIREVGFLDRRKAESWTEATRDMRRGFYRKPCTAEVKSVTPLGDRPAYGVSVADVHSYDANGIVMRDCDGQ
ncbi:LAGLIDADG family homing endonuclease [Micromonospora sp. WMMD812]|uniref:LAGLIDADG family homing endonuclease n=1 Tax=Micromonospora sp. WMMD812 TaxID=3015152 RepID=UPI00248D0374|nr:LAGLIDADG family homing endonuclease [Micromonospora sp. WMMD812]WBB70772.1 hypothetical protein O7603_16035 [Micromonospora sp. WMMD812]